MNAARVQMLNPGVWDVWLRSSNDWGGLTSVRSSRGFTIIPRSGIWCRSRLSIINHSPRFCMRWGVSNIFSSPRSAGSIQNTNVVFVSVTVLIVCLPRHLGRQFQVHLVREIKALPDLCIIARGWDVDNVSVIGNARAPDLRIGYDPATHVLLLLHVDFGHLSVEGGGE
jgi:hypothetical protein